MEASAQEGGLIRKLAGFDGGKKRNSAPTASVFSVRRDRRFPAKSLGEEECGGLEEGQAMGEAGLPEKPAGLPGPGEFGSSL